MCLSSPQSQFHHPFAVVTTPAETQKLIGSFASPHAADLCSEKLWLGHRATGGRWTARFVTRTDAGFGFLSVFLEVLMRRARSVLSVSYFASKVRGNALAAVGCARLRCIRRMAVCLPLILLRSHAAGRAKAGHPQKGDNGARLHPGLHRADQQLLAPVTDDGAGVETDVQYWLRPSQVRGGGRVLVVGRGGGGEEG